MLRLSDGAMARLRAKHQVLAEVIDSDRAVDAMRRTNVIDLAVVMTRRERIRAAGRCYGHQLRGDGNCNA